MILGGFIRFVRNLLFSVSRTPQRSTILITEENAVEEALTYLLQEDSIFFPVTACLVDSVSKDIKKNFTNIFFLNTLQRFTKFFKQKEVFMLVFYFHDRYLYAQRLRGVVNICRDKEVQIKKLVSRHRNNKQIFQITSVHPEELLKRKPITLDDFSIQNIIEDKVVLITGAGGSIGSELSRQIIKYRPKLLIFYEVTELFLYNLETEFQTEYPQVNFVPILGNIQDPQRTDWVLRTYRPGVIFHAAAYKHVPMMEKNPMAAIQNNIEGTWYLANLAKKYNIERFILISTDKAVNPVNIMGASKRVCEIICQYLQNRTMTTKFMAVRFGNVLGSAGSVVEKFQSQIERGGPITVTHPDIKRYFMSITESCQLVMQAAAIGNGGEIFLLDMEEPIKILELAKQMVTLAGQVPDKGIEIHFTGLRPGEKLYEELLSDAETTVATTYPRMRIVQMREAPFNLEEQLQNLFHLSTNCSVTEVKHVLKSLVPELKTIFTEKQEVFPKTRLKVLKK